MKNDKYEIKNDILISPISNDIESNQTGFDLLNIRLIKTLIDWKGYPYIFQAVMLLVFVSLIFIGWQVYTPEGVSDKLFAKTHIVTLIIWGIWWPLMVWLAVTMGRVWCMICPLELVSNITERLSRKLGIKLRAISKWIRGGTIIVFIYALIQLLVAGIHLHRIPAYTSFFLIGLLTLSGFVGFFFKDRAFCTGFCPIGMLLNAYGRGGMIAVRAGSENVCKSCTGKDCIISCNRNKLDSRSCPSLLNPPMLNSNKDCLVCGQCIKSCQPDNMQLLLRKPFDKNDLREEKANWGLTFFVMLVSGFVTAELTTEWKTANKIFTAIPEYIVSITGITSYSGFIEGIWTIIVFPVLLWTILGLLSIVTKGAESLTDAWRKLALPLVIIISAGHLTKAVAKLNAWVVFLPESLNNSDQLIAGLNLPLPVFTNLTISFIGIMIITAGLFYSIREQKIKNEKYYVNLLPRLVLYLIFITIAIGISFN